MQGIGDDDVGLARGVGNGDREDDDDSEDEDDDGGRLSSVSTANSG